MEKKHDIVVEDLSFAYNEKDILIDVNFTVEKGEFISIVGPNGGGKTTLLKLILGMERCEKGEILLFGDDPVRSRQKVGYMPQYAHLDSSFPATVMDVVLMGRLKPWKFRFSSRDKSKAVEAIDDVGLKGLENDAFKELSGGQRQRALIARALCGDPELLLLDEPMNNVDQETESSLYRILQKLNEKMTIVIVSHDLGFVSRYVQKVVCVNRRVLIHPTSEIKDSHIHNLYATEVKMVRHDKQHN